LYFSNVILFLFFRECPLDLKEAISSVCFAAPRCGDLPELLQVQTLFASKYGKEFVAAATELRPACGVNRQVF
jgi:vacuolar protein sorting-associated protein IST1